MTTRKATCAAVAMLAAAPSAVAQDSQGPSQFDSLQSSPMTEDATGLRATVAFPTRQDRNQWLGSNLIGARVVSPMRQPIGKIANLVVNDDGAIEAVIVRMGGVLGLGQKDVAVNFKSLNFTRRESGELDYIMLAATKEDLSQVVEFKTLEKQKSEEKQRTSPVPPTR